MQLNELGRKEVWTKWLVISLAVLLSKSFVSNFLLNKLPEFVPGFLIDLISIFGIIVLVDIISGLILEA